MSTVVCVILGLMLGCFLFFFFTAVFTLIFGKIIGYEFISFNFYCFRIRKVNGKLTFSIGNIYFATMCYMIKLHSTVRDEILYNTLPTLANFALCAVLIGCCINIDFEGIYNAVYYSLRINLIFNIWHLFLCANTIINYTSDKPSAVLWRTIRSVLDSLQWGMRPSAIEFPLKDIPRDKVKFTELRYYLFLYYHFLEKNDYENVRKIIDLFEINIPNVASQIYTPYIYELIFYYSFIAKDIEKAHSYYTLMDAELINDKDMNGRRVYAYYLYYTNKGRQNALNVAMQGIAVADHFQFGGLAEMELDLLNSLINKIKEEA